MTMDLNSLPQGLPFSLGLHSLGHMGIQVYGTHPQAHGLARLSSTKNGMCFIQSDKGFTN